MRCRPRKCGKISVKNLKFAPGGADVPSTTDDGALHRVLWWRQTLGWLAASLVLRWWLATDDGAGGWKMRLRQLGVNRRPCDVQSRISCPPAVYGRRPRRTCYVPAPTGSCYDGTGTQSAS